MKFNATKAQNWYSQMFGDRIDQSVIDEAKSMTVAEFEAAEPGCDEDGEYLESPFSAGQYDCINDARY